MTINVVRPESVGLSGRQLGRIEDHLKRRYIDPGKIAGALTLVCRKDMIAYLCTQGKMDIRQNTPMQTDTIFRIYSMTKPITSVAAMMLYEQGFFQLHDPVGKFIPGFNDLRVYSSGNYPNFITKPAERPMSIRDLFMHTSGLTYGFMETTNVDAAYRKLNIGGIGVDHSLEQMIKLLSQMPLLYSPGTYWSYSVSTDVLGYLVERFSGMPYDEYLKKYIFGPLQMTDTDFFVPEEKMGRFAANYSRNPDKTLKLEDDPKTGLFSKKPKYLSGGGGLVSTASDYLRFCRMLLNGGELDGARILGRKTLEMMTKNHMPNKSDLAECAFTEFSETNREGFGFGLGFSIHLGSERSQIIGSLGEYAWGGAASTLFWIDPVEDLIVIFLTQFMPSGTFDFRGQLKALIYPAIL